MGVYEIITSRKRSLGQGNILHQFVILFTAWPCVVSGGVCGYGGVCVVQGACMLGGHAWGWACMVLGGWACVVVGEHVWLWGGVHGCGGCVWLRGTCIGYDEIWSMSGQYASYSNAFLFFFSFFRSISETKK